MRSLWCSEKEAGVDNLPPRPRQAEPLVKISGAPGPSFLSRINLKETYLFQYLKI